MKEGRRKKFARASDAQLCDASVRSGSKNRVTAAEAHFPFFPALFPAFFFPWFFPRLPPAESAVPLGDSPAGFAAAGVAGSAAAATASAAGPEEVGASVAAVGCDFVQSRKKKG